MDELTTYNDLQEFLKELKYKIPRSKQYLIDNLKDILTNCAVLVTTSSQDSEQDAINNIEEILR